MIMSSIPGRAQRGACPLGGDGRGLGKQPTILGLRPKDTVTLRCGFPEVLVVSTKAIQQLSEEQKPKTTVISEVRRDGPGRAVVPSDSRFQGRGCGATISQKQLSTQRAKGFSCVLK